MIFHNWEGVRSLTGFKVGKTYLASDPLTSWNTVRKMVWSTRFNYLHRGFLAIQALLSISRVIAHRSANRLFSW